LRGYLGLGSNEGDRLGALRAARAALARHDIEVVASSSVYETEPQGEVRDQPDFLNACLAIETELGPDELLAVCKDVEREIGVLLLGELQHRSDPLTIPHPEVRARRFVVEPLLELDSELTLPGGLRLADTLAGMSDQRVERNGAL
jgi:2-amino-4-hydroxy-6-hydroxymethyldihydropteridine diphosphokinase